MTPTGIVIIVASGLVALIIYGLGVLTGAQLARRTLRPGPLHLGDMPGHPESLAGGLDPRDEDALDAIAARLPRRRLRLPLPLRGRS
jgi:hypothetical protein